MGSDQHNGKNYIPLTQTMIERLVEAKDRTGWGYRGLYRYCQQLPEHHQVFDRTTYGMPLAWATGEVKSVDPDYYDAILAAYGALPEEIWGKAAHVSTRSSSRRVMVRAELRDKLRSFIDQPRQMPLPTLLKGYNVPKKLTPALLSNIASGKTKSVKDEYLEIINQILNH